MSKPRKQNKLIVKLKEDKGARAIAVTVTVMLLVLTRAAHAVPCFRLLAAR